MAKREFPVGQLHDNLPFIFSSVARGDVVEVKNRTTPIARFRKAADGDHNIATRHPERDFVRQAGPLLRQIKAPFLITGVGGGIVAVVEPV